MVALDTLHEDDHALIDQESLPKVLDLKSAIEEVWNSLTAQERELFEDLLYQIKPRDIALEHGKSAKTIRNKKSALLRLIRQQYILGAYTFALEELNALHRTVGIRSGWDIQ